VHVTGTALAEIKRLDWNEREGSPIPMDQARTQHVFIDEPFVATQESRKKIVVRPAAIGFAFGAFHSNLGALHHLVVSLDQKPRGWVPLLLLSPTTGEFIAGPLPSGPNLLHFRVSVSQRAFAIPIDIDPNKERQSRLDIDIDNTPGKDSC
jgi:hypothetical protein